MDSRFLPGRLQKRVVAPEPPERLRPERYIQASVRTNFFDNLVPVHGVRTSQQAPAAGAGQRFSR